MRFTLQAPLVVAGKLVCRIFFLGSVKGHSSGVKPRAVMRVVRQSVGGRKQ